MFYYNPPHFLSVRREATKKVFYTQKTWRVAIVSKFVYTH